MNHTADIPRAAPRHPGAGSVLLAVGLVGALIVLVGLLPAPLQNRLLAEGSVVETLSALGYLVSIALMLRHWDPAAIRARWYFPLLLAAFTAREFDLDKRFFTEGLLKARQLTGDTVALPEKILSAVLVLLLVATCLILLRREMRRFLRALAAGRPAALAVLAGTLLIVSTKTIDGLARKLAPFGIDPDAGTLAFAAVVEEVGELGIPVLFALAIVMAAPGKVPQ